MHARAARERAHWDRVYSTTGTRARFLWMKHDEGVSYLGECFFNRLRDLRAKRVLSLAGGVDRLGIALAQAGNRVVTVDVSPVAAEATLALAQEAGAAANLTCVVAAAEEAPLDRESFDVVLCKRALHHLDLPTVVQRVHEALVPGGMLLAEEPVCFLRWMQWIHKRFPFHPDRTRSEDERELTQEDLKVIGRTFGTVQLSYFDLLTRESVAHFFCKWRLERLLNPLGKMDHFLLNRCLPPLRYFATWILIEATKQPHGDRHD